MSLRATTWFLWLVLVLLLPLPYFMIDSGRIPAAQLFMYAALTAPLTFTDPGFTTRFIAGLFLSQALMYGALLYVGSQRVSQRVPAARRVLVVLGIAVLLGAFSLLNVYRAPLSYGPGPTNIVGIYK